ncbi:MAG: type II toxin-antitoxin system PemK/MazF family toxin [Epsilonproteobacteria bacterium]|nr:type II toxin-antitoxin system PemK/MazF family toxin [Campylobacterota bacterium]
MNRGDIFWVNLNRTIGSEIRKQRPCVILSANPINKARHTIVIVPLSTAVKEHHPITVSVYALNKNAVAVCDQIRAVDKTRLLKRAGKLSPQDIEKIEDGLRQVLAL